MASLTSDIACGGCGYNLRGLERSGLCPECGHGIQSTLAWLTDARAAWMRSVASGAMWIGVGTLIGGVALGSLIVWTQSGMFVVLPLGALACMFGTWQFATPVPRILPASCAPSREAKGRDLFSPVLRLAGIATCLLQIFMTLTVAYQLGNWLRPGIVFSQRQMEAAFDLTVAMWALTSALNCIRAALLASRLGSFTALMQGYALAALSGIILLATAGLWLWGSVFWGVMQFIVAVAVCAWSMMYFLASAMMLQRHAGQMRAG
jgi:hypothetical protein